MVLSHLLFYHLCIHIFHQANILKLLFYFSLGNVNYISCSSLQALAVNIIDFILFLFFFVVSSYSSLSKKFFFFRFDWFSGEGIRYLILLYQDCFTFRIWQKSPINHFSSFSLLCLFSYLPLTTPIAREYFGFHTQHTALSQMSVGSSLTPTARYFGLHFYLSTPYMKLLNQIWK